MRERTKGSDQCGQPEARFTKARVSSRETGTQVGAGVFGDQANQVVAAANAFVERGWTYAYASGHGSHGDGVETAGVQQVTAGRHDCGD